MPPIMPAILSTSPESEAYINAKSTYQDLRSKLRDVYLYVSGENRPLKFEEEIYNHQLRIGQTIFYTLMSDADKVSLVISSPLGIPGVDFLEGNVVSVEYYLPAEMDDAYIYADLSGTEEGKTIKWGHPAFLSEINTLSDMGPPHFMKLTQNQ